MGCTTSVSCAMILGFCGGFAGGSTWAQSSRSLGQMQDSCWEPKNHLQCKRAIIHMRVEYEAYHIADVYENGGAARSCVTRMVRVCGRASMSQRG